MVLNIILKYTGNPVTAPINLLWELPLAYLIFQWTAGFGNPMIQVEQLFSPDKIPPNII